MQGENLGMHLGGEQEENVGPHIACKDLILSAVEAEDREGIAPSGWIPAAMAPMTHHTAGWAAPLRMSGFRTRLDREVAIFA